MLAEAKLFDLEVAFHHDGSDHNIDSQFADPHGSRAVARRFDMPLAMTHSLKNEAPRMDRIYVRSMSIDAAGVCHGELGPSEVANAVKGTKLCTLSDHALVWADLSF